MICHNFVFAAAKSQGRAWPDAIAEDCEGLTMVRIPVFWMLALVAGHMAVAGDCDDLSAFIAKVAKIKHGMSKDSVMEILGVPALAKSRRYVWECGERSVEVEFSNKGVAISITDYVRME